MQRKGHIPIAPGKLGAWVCLLAVALLWTPLWATGSQNKGMACCAGKMCAARGHAKAGHTSENAGISQESAPMVCGREGQARLSMCGMNCCHEEGSTMMAAVIFVMPKPTKISAPAEAHDTREQAPAVIASSLFETPSPPPRSIIPKT